MGTNTDDDVQVKVEPIEGTIPVGTLSNGVQPTWDYSDWYSPGSYSGSMAKESPGVLTTTTTSAGGSKEVMQADLT